MDVNWVIDPRNEAGRSIEDVPLLEIDMDDELRSGDGRQRDGNRNGRLVNEERRQADERRELDDERRRLADKRQRMMDKERRLAHKRDNHQRAPIQRDNVNERRKVRDQGGIDSDEDLSSNLQRFHPHTAERNLQGQQLQRIEQGQEGDKDLDEEAQNLNGNRMPGQWVTPAQQRDRSPTLLAPRRRPREKNWQYFPSKT